MKKGKCQKSALGGVSGRGLAPPAASNFKGGGGCLFLFRKYVERPKLCSILLGCLMTSDPAGQKNPQHIHMLTSISTESILSLVNVLLLRIESKTRYHQKKLRAET